MSEAHLFNIAGHALVGCLSAIASRGQCGPAVLAGAVTSFAGPFINGRGFSIESLVANATLGGLAAVAGGGKFANGAITGAFGYLFNQAARDLGGTSGNPRDLGRYYSNNDQNIRLDANNAPADTTIRTWTIGGDDDTTVTVRGQPRDVTGWQEFDLPPETTVQGRDPNTGQWAPSASAGPNGAFIYYNLDNGQFFAKLKVPNF
jgi:hypothetical protein